LKDGDVQLVWRPSARLHGDPEHVIGVDQQPPRGLRRKVAEDVAVAGISQPDARLNALAFISGSDRTLELRRVPEHPVDPNALEVIARWRESEVERSGRLGYVPADVAALIAKEERGAPIGATIEVIFAPIPGKESPGVRFDIWAPRLRRARPTEQPYRQDFEVPADPLERNLRGIKLEAEGFIDNAIECYQANVRDGSEGNGPYDRLAIIFRRRGDSASEIATLTRAIEVFERLNKTSQRLDVIPKLEKFRQQLRKALARRESEAQALCTTQRQGLSPEGSALPGVISAAH
jgi:hypothetical protein